MYLHDVHSRRRSRRETAGTYMHPIYFLIKLIKRLLRMGRMQISTQVVAILSLVSENAVFQHMLIIQT